MDDVLKFFLELFTTVPTKFTLYLLIFVVIILLATR